MSELALLPAFTSAGLAAIAAAHGQGLSLKITALAFGDTAYDVRDGNGVPLAAARARVALENERVRVGVAAGNAVTVNSILVVGEVPAALPEFWIKEVGFFAEDGTLVAVWSMADQTLGWRGANAPWLFKFVLSWSDLPPNAITVVFDGDATLSALATDMARLDAKVHHTVVTGGGIAWDELDDTQLTDAIQAMIAAGIGAINLKQKTIVASEQTFAVGVADGDPVRWNAGAGNWAKAQADGTANNLGLGIADVTNGEVILCGETRAGLLAGLTPGAAYYIGAVGGLSATADTDGVKVGVAKSATALWVDIDAVPTSAASVGGAFRNLTVQVSSNTQIQVTADALVLTDAAGGAKLFSPNVTVSTAAVGANGLDAGAVVNSTWYAVWVIGKADGTVAGLLSTSATAPNLPAGYAYKARIGMVRSNGTGVLYRTIQRGRRAEWVIDGMVLTGRPVLASGSTSNVTTAVAWSTAAPPTAATLIMQAVIWATNGTYWNFSIGPTSTDISACFINQSNQAAVFSLIPVGLNFYWSTNQSGCTVYAYGWEDSI
jgi:hypothetical protein